MSQSLSSPLTLQMLLASNGGVNQFPQDPAMAPSVARLQLAQSMMQNGMSSAPTEKFGALSRIGQALLGNYVFDKANTGIQDVLTQRAQQAGAANDYIMGGPSTPAGVAPGMPPKPTPISAPGAAPIQTFATQLASSEGSPGSVNKQGFSGQYQFGADRLASNGLYTPAQGENLKGNEWKGTFNIPGFPQVKTQADFLANPQAQNAALEHDLSNTDKAIANTPGAAAFDQNGLRAVAHLGGVAGMQKFVQSNGQYNPADANGTALSDYYRKFSGGGPQQGAPSVSAPAPGTAPSMPNPFEVQRRALAVLNNPALMYNQQAQQSAQRALELAHSQIQLGSWSTLPDGTQVNAYTGEKKSAAEPRPNYVPTPTGATETTGTKPPVFARPGVVEQLTLSQLTDKLARGEQLTPGEQTQYNMALANFQHPEVIKTGPNETATLAPIRPNPIPPGIGQPPGGMPGAPVPASPMPQPPGGAVPLPQSASATPPPVTPATTSAPAPGAPTTDAAHPIITPNLEAIAKQAQAASQGSTSGTQAAATLPQMRKLGTEAAQGLGTIDSAIAQLNESQKQGIPTGYFTPALATAAAAAKSLGIDTSKLGVDPAGVSSIQAANKSLALTAGSIVRQILGPDSQITEGKLETFIHATPSLSTDPQAIQKILGWARSQFVYNHDMAMDAMRHADPTTGMIPPGWEPQYYAKQNSMGPIYNPLHGEMEQPKGQGPAATMPTQAAAPAPKAAPIPLDVLLAEQARRAKAQQK